MGQVRKQAAYILLSCDVGHERAVLDEIKKYDYVESASLVFGAYDIIAKIEAPDIDALRDLVQTKIRKMNEKHLVHGTMTLLLKDYMKS